MAEALLTQDERTEVIRMYTDMKGKYSELDTALKAGKPVGEIKAGLEKVSADLAVIQAAHQKEVERANAAEVVIQDLKKQIRLAPEAPKTLGKYVTEDKGLMDQINSGMRRFGYTVQIKRALRDVTPVPWELKVIMGLSQYVPQVQPGIATGPRLAIGVRTLVPQGSTSAGSIEWLAETSFTNSAAPVAEGAKKPESTKVYTPQVSPVVTLAHFFKVSRQSLNDVPGLEANIESNGIYGVQVVEDDQLLNGDGVAPNLTGFLKNAVAAPAPPVPGTGMQANTILDAIGMAYFDLATKGYLPDGTVVNPADWGSVALMRSTMGNYLFANPIDFTPIPRVWGMRLVQSVKQAAGTFLVGAFQGNS